MFNQPLNFDTADVTSMADMFHVSSALSDLKRWTRHRPSHQGHQSPHGFPACICPLLLTWQGAAAFNQLLSFDTSSVTDMSGMFQVRSVLCPNLSSWDHSSSTFCGTHALHAFFGSKRGHSTSRCFLTHQVSRTRAGCLRCVARALPLPPAYAACNPRPCSQLSSMVFYVTI